MKNNILKWKYTLRLAQTALLSSAALVLSAIEMMIPDMPFMLPGMKLGLSNIATMFAIESISLKAGLAVTLIKALFALTTRGLTAFLMSLCGGVLSTLVMYAVLKCKKPQFGNLGIGIAGAFFHNLGQLLVAFLFTDSTVFAYLPVLCAASIITGSITGLCVYVTLPYITRLKVYKA